MTTFGIDEATIEAKLEMVKRLVAGPWPKEDPAPSDVGGSIFVGNKHHAANVSVLVGLGVTAVLNCAPSGIRNLPLDGYASNNIFYNFTNVAQDAHDYPILHNHDGVASEHFEVALACYEKVLQTGGKVLFFCVAGQNRSATLAIAVQVARGISYAWQALNQRPSNARVRCRRARGDLSAGWRASSACAPSPAPSSSRTPAFSDS